MEYLLKILCYFSSWRFVHKDKTMFGDELWLSVFGLNNNKDDTNSDQFDIVDSPTVSLISITTAGASVDENLVHNSKPVCLSVCLSMFVCMCVHIYVQ